MGIYPEDKDQVVRKDSAVTQYQRVNDKQVPLKPDLPGTVILIHGVNDVGVSYGGVEAGLCEGLGKRLKQKFVPGTVRLPQEEDEKKLHDDPDAVFFKRTVDAKTHSPVIPFYWGFREFDDQFQRPEETSHGQAMDRYGNRLDKDFSKGGGPFANATATLPDMWWRGKGGAGGALDKANKDPIRPVLNSPGRMYMVLGAQRLAALISIIRDWDTNETVSIVAHSQGCMLSLLAQAFLLQRGLRPADTLVLTHPPYSLIDDLPFTSDAADLSLAGTDSLMEGRYQNLVGGQTMHARLQTLINIVEGVSQNRHTTPSLTQLKEPEARGVVGARWEPSGDRDNRGKVFLYFCPEDATVALENVQGIGWQGIPDYLLGSQIVEGPALQNGPGGPARTGKVIKQRKLVWRKPLSEIGAGFFQRVFTGRKRPNPVKGQRVKVGGPPGDFALRVKGEGDWDHAVKMGFFDGGRYARGSLAKVESAEDSTKARSAEERAGWRTINAEPLPQAVDADMVAGGLSADELPEALKRKPPGAYEKVDPIDAAISVTSKYGSNGDGVYFDDDNSVWLVMSEPTDRLTGWVNDSHQRSPKPEVFSGFVYQVWEDESRIGSILNKGKSSTQQSTVQAVYRCHRTPTPLLLVKRTETSEEMRLRWQKSASTRSFHGAIFGSETNHRNVTAYDIAIGQGRAPSDPKFYAYLCAVADWRLKKPSKGTKSRPGILMWSDFQSQFARFYAVEPVWRKALIEGNCDYYSTGWLPTVLPVLPEGLPRAVVCETMSGQQVIPEPAKPLSPADARRAAGLREWEPPSVPTLRPDSSNAQPGSQ